MPVVTLTLLDTRTQTVLQQWYFEHELVIRIGRAPDNQVVLNDTLVSRYHLELRQLNQASAATTWQLISRGTNGTFLNGVLVLRSEIQDGALLRLAQNGPTLKVQIQPQPGPKVSLPAFVPVARVNPIMLSPDCNHADNAPGNLFCVRCGHPIAVQESVRQYHILRTLGQGGMGTTYLACTPTNGLTASSLVASPKQPQPKYQLLVLKALNTDMAQIAKAQELFEREARTLQALRHPGIPRFFDFFVEAGKKYLVMELIHGQDLEKRIYQQGVVSPSQAIAWMLQTCEVLDYLHCQNPPIIHRDIKPGNLLVRKVDQRVVVVDFGAVKELSSTFGTRIGAEGYSAPEQNRGYPVIQSDLYAIGPTLIFLLTAESPSRFYKRQGQAYRFDLKGIPTITPKLKAVIERVTEFKWGDRYRTARELAQALSNCL